MDILCIVVMVGVSVITDGKWLMVMVRLSERIVQAAFLSLPELVFLYAYSSRLHVAVLGLIRALLLCHMQHFCRLWMRAAPRCGFAPSRTTCSYLHCSH